jgi:hypothetical protein
LSWPKRTRVVVPIEEEEEEEEEEAQLPSQSRVRLLKDARNMANKSPLSKQSIGLLRSRQQPATVNGAQQALL